MQARDDYGGLNLHEDPGTIKKWCKTCQISNSADVIGSRFNLRRIRSDQLRGGPLSPLVPRLHFGLVVAVHRVFARTSSSTPPDSHRTVQLQNSQFGLVVEAVRIFKHRSSFISHRVAKQCNFKTHASGYGPSLTSAPHHGAVNSKRSEPARGLKCPSATQLPARRQPTYPATLPEPERWTMRNADRDEQECFRDDEQTTSGLPI